MSLTNKSVQCLTHTAIFRGQMCTMEHCPFEVYTVYVHLLLQSFLHVQLKTERETQDVNWFHWTEGKRCMVERSMGQASIACMVGRQ